MTESCEDKQPLDTYWIYSTGHTLTHTQRDKRNKIKCQKSGTQRNYNGHRTCVVGIQKNKFHSQVVL